MGKKSGKRDFYEEDSVHGFVKRLMFKKYFQAYIGKTQNFQNGYFTFDTVYIDGFAGEGRYSNDWPSEIANYGSPLIALMVVLEFYHNKDMKEQKKRNESEVEMAKTRSSIGNKYQKMGNNDQSEMSTKVSRNSSEGRTKGKHKQLTVKRVTKADENRIWGWSALELDPEDELVVELRKHDYRKPYFGGHARITLIFIEMKKNRYQKLAANVELLVIKFLTRYYPNYRYGFSREEGKIRLNINTGLFSLYIEIVNKSFADTTPPMLLQNQRVRSLTYLDSFGFTQTPMSHVQKYASGLGNEILINFMSSYVNRQVSRCPKGVEQQFGITDYKAVARYYGIDPPDLNREDGLADFIKNVIHSSKPEREQEFSNNINKCARNYEDFLKSRTKCKYSLMFEIKNKRNSTFFHMIHCTNHIKGVEAMKESMNRCSQKEGKMVMSDYDIICKEQELNFGNMDDPKIVAELVFNKFRGKKGIKKERIKEYILLETNYLFRIGPLKILQRSKKMTVEREDCKCQKGKDCKCQKGKFTFPDKDGETKEPITWLLTFTDEDYSSKTVDVHGADTKTKTEKGRTMKQRREKLKKDKQPPSKVCNEDKKVILQERKKSIKYAKKTSPAKENDRSKSPADPEAENKRRVKVSLEADTTIMIREDKNDKVRKRRKSSSKMAKNEDAPTVKKARISTLD